MVDVQQQLKGMRTLVQEMGWGEFMRHVGSLMAEQSDKTSGDQSSALFACSNTVHALVEAWDGCGKFVYPDEMTLATPVHDIVMWLIECRTGCSCCQYENHRRGPYRSREDAETRIEYFRSEDSKFWPVASQYARRGRYVIERHEPEMLSGDRYIIEDEVHEGMEFVTVNDNGTVADNDSERFG